VPPPQLGAGDRVRHELRLAVERHHVAALARDHHVAPQVDERCQPAPVRTASAHLCGDGVHVHVVHVERLRVREPAGELHRRLPRGLREPVLRLEAEPAVVGVRVARPVRPQVQLVRHAEAHARQRERLVGAEVVLGIRMREGVVPRIRVLLHGEVQLLEPERDVTAAERRGRGGGLERRERAELTREAAERVLRQVGRELDRAVLDAGVDMERRIGRIVGKRRRRRQDHQGDEKVASTRHGMDLPREPRA